MPPVTVQLLSGLCALSLLSGGCFRAGYELLELDGLSPDDTTAGSPPPGASGLDAGVLLWQPGALDGGATALGDGDASSSTPVVDAGTDCRWATPVVLSLPQTSNAQLFGGPHLSPDGSILYFSMQLGGSSEDVYRATRSSPDDNFSAPVLVSEVNSTSADGSPFVTADDSSIYFFSQRGGAMPAARDVYVASRGTTGGPFGTPTALLQVNSTQMDQSPHLSSDGLELWLGSHRGGTGFEDLYVARRTRTTDTFGVPTAVSELNSPGIDTGAALSQDSSTVYYSSERSGGAGGLDLWQARRASRGSRFANAEPLVELNGRDDDFDPTLTADEQELVFVSNRSGSPRLWHAVRYCE